MELKYFYGNEVKRLAFYQIPKALFTDEHFRGISPEAKIIYSLLLDRMSLSVKNDRTEANAGAACSDEGFREISLTS